MGFLNSLSLIAFAAVLIGCSENHYAADISVPACIDSDNDGFGVGCDAGRDCDDTDSAVSVDCSAVALPLALRVVSAQRKIFLNDYGSVAAEITHDGAIIELAREEYESVQLAVFPGQNASGEIEITVTDLRQRGGDVVLNAQRHIEVNPVSYINLPSPRFPDSHSGWYPDPLLPNQAVDLQPGVVQPFLITVFAAIDTPSGEYVGNIIVQGTDGRRSVLPLRVIVWDFILPKISRFKAAALADWDTPREMWPESLGYPVLSNEKLKEQMLKLADLGFRNRLAPTAYLANGFISWNKAGQGDTGYGYPTHDDGVFNAERTGEMIDYMLAKGANHFFIGLTNNIYKIPALVDARETALRNYLQDYRDFLISRNLQHMAYIYGIDEPWDEAVQQAKSTYRFVKANGGDVIKFMQNTNQHNDRIIPELIEAFDVLDINLGWYKKVKAEKYRSRYPEAFAEFWWNINLWPDTRPNFLLENPLTDIRIIGPMSYAYRMQGFEYWQLFHKNSIENYYPLPADALRVDWRINKNSLDGSLVYPGEGYQIYSSLRYESFRDGMEDLEYLYMLEALDPKHRLLQVPIVGAIDRYEDDPDKILLFRRRLAAAILNAKRKAGE